MFDRLIVLLTNVSLVLENVFVYLLQGLQELTVFFAESFETLISFVNIFGFSVLQLLFQSSKIFIIFSPGILFAWIGYYHSIIMLIIGVVYMLLLIFAAFGFKTVATENGIMSGNTPNQWLWYFPYSWVKIEFIREKLSNVLQLHNRLRTLSAEFNNNVPFKDDILKIAKNSSFKLIVVRKNLFKIIRKTQIKYGIKSNFNLIGYGILSSNENYNEELRRNIYEYLDPFEKQYSKLVENLENLHNKLQSFTQSENNLNESEKESFHTEIEDIESLLKALDSINEDSI